MHVVDCHRSILRSQTGGVVAAGGPVPSSPIIWTMTPGNYQFTVIWLAPETLPDGSAVGTLTGQTVYWGTTQGEQHPGGSFAGSQSVTVGTLTLNKTGLANATTYWVSVTATNAVGESEPSPEVSVTTT